jgi:polyisoprenoid-binding protein YceI
MKKLILGAAVLATLSFTAVEVSNWGIDASHSRMGFTFNHQGIAEMQGEFKKVDVTVSASAADFSDAKIELTAAMSICKQLTSWMPRNTQLLHSRVAP